MVCSVSSRNFGDSKTSGYYAVMMSVHYCILMFVVLHAQKLASRLSPQFS